MHRGYGKLEKSFSRHTPHSRTKYLERNPWCKENLLTILGKLRKQLHVKWLTSCCGERSMTFLFSRAWGLYLDLPVPWSETTSSGSLLELELQANIQKPCGIPECCLIRLHWNLSANISSIQLYHLSGLVFLNGAIARIWSLFFHGVRPCRFIGTCFLTSCPYLQKKVAAAELRYTVLRSSLVFLSRLTLTRSPHFA